MGIPGEFSEVSDNLASSHQPIYSGHRKVYMLDNSGTPELSIIYYINRPNLCMQNKTDI